MLVASLACLALLVIPGRAFGFQPLTTFGSTGKGPGQLSQANGIAIGPDGLLYIANSGNNRIDIFTPEGSLVRSLGKEAIPVPGDGCEQDENCQDDGSGAAGVLRVPRDLAIDSAGNVFVADYGNYRIDVFSSQGAFIRAFGKGVNPSGGDVCTEATGCQRGSGGTAPGVIAAPTGIGIDAAGLLYVAGANLRVDVFSSEGAYVRRIGKEVNPSGDGCTEEQNCLDSGEVESAGAMNTPYDVVVDASGRVAVADYRNFRIDVFTSSGGFIHSFGKSVNPSGGDVCTASTGCRKGTESGLAGGLGFPSALAVSPSGGLYVADIRNNRINEFGFDGTFVRAFGEGVTSGVSAFEVCSASSGCRAGISGTNPGSVSGPRGTAVDCGGAIYAVELRAESEQEASSSRVERFGEPGTPDPPCTPPPSRSSPPSAPSTEALSALGGGRPRTAKPSIKVELNKGSGTASLIVIVSDPGTLLLKGKGIRKVKRQAKRPGLIELLVAPKGATKRKLEETGKAAVKLSLTFNADNGASNRQAKKIGLKMVAPL